MKHLRIDRPVSLLFAGMLATLITAWAIYAQGFAGGFLFDDWANLPALGAQGPIDNAPAFLRYITSGTADPTGRPISLLSFLMDARDWPAPPLPFKRTNLLVHLANGLLLAGLLWRLGAWLAIEHRRRALAAWLGASAWMLHPLFASTVLYVVQREALLPATFALLALHAWLSCRRQFTEGSAPGMRIVAAISVFTVLAFLSKANGLLVPLLVVIIECCLPPPAHGARRYRRWLGIACAPWIAALVLGLTWFAVHGVDNLSPGYRGWSVAQRLLTEPTILWTYLGQLALVVRIAGSVFHDQYPAALSLFDPWWTSLAIVACILTILLAWRYRHRQPALAMALLFFFAAHLVESTSIPLELYFEHRNYLPAMLLFWPLGLALGNIRRPYVGVTAAALIVTAASALTFDQATLWGHPLLQALTWAAESPGSARAQAYAAQMEAAAGLREQALRRLDSHRDAFADEPQVAFALLDIRCQAGSVDAGDLAYAGTALRTARREPGRLLLNWFSGAITTVQQHACAGLDDEALERLLAEAAANPRIATLPGRLQDIEHIRGDMALASGDLQAARSHFDAALRLAPSPQGALEQAASLGRAGAPELAVGHLDLYSQLTPPALRGPSAGMAWVHDRVLSHQNYWDNELAHLRAALAHASRTPTR